MRFLTPIETFTNSDLVHSFGNPKKPYTVKPLLFHQPATDTSEERIITQLARRTYVGYEDLPRSKKIPPITEAQAEALDALHFLGERFHIGLDLRQGDVQYINNLAVFHARDDFQDTAEQQ